MQPVPTAGYEAFRVATGLAPPMLPPLLSGNAERGTLFMIR